MTDLLRVSSPAQIAELAELAREIWTEHYTPIIGQRQVEYMLARFQSAEAIAAQIVEGCEYYMAVHDETAVGYLALVPAAGDDSLMISKLYVARSERGHGFGREMLGFAEELCRKRHIATLWLTVNKNNTRSIEWYARMGFSNAGPVVQDIGAGFVMDDYRLTKAVV